MTRTLGFQQGYDALQASPLDISCLEADSSAQYQRKCDHISSVATISSARFVLCVIFRSLSVGVVGDVSYVMALNLTPLRNLHPRQLAQKLRQLVVDHSENAISAQLLAEVDGGSVPPAVACVWLSVSKTPVALADALLQSHSILVRRFAIKRIGKALRKPQWRDVWNHLGGTEGLLSVFAHLSVQDVKLLARAIGRCSKGQTDGEKQQQVTELLCGLLGSRYPNAPYKTRDERPLHSHYAKLIPACSQDFIRTLLRQDSNPVMRCFPVDHLLQTHYGLVRRLVLNAIFNGATDPDNLPEYLQSLLRRMPPIQSAQPGLSASMYFSLTLLRELSRQPEDVNFSSKLFLPGLVEPLMRRALRQRVDTPLLLEIAELAITYLRNDSSAAQNLSARRGTFLYCVVRCWSRNQDLFEDELVSVIWLLQHNNNRDIGQYQDIIRAVPRSRRYALLRLLVLHTKGLGADISVEDELRSLRLAKWPSSIFTAMMKDQAVSLLRALIRVKPEASFLRLETGYTILAIPRSPGVDHADPALLLTLLERGQTGALERAEKGKSLAISSAINWANIFFSAKPSTNSREKHRQVGNRLTEPSSLGRLYFGPLRVGPQRSMGRL
jgi:hypothetical protein